MLHPFPAAWLLILQAVLPFEHQQKPTNQQKLSVSGQLTEACSVASYGGGCRKGVANQMLRVFADPGWSPDRTRERPLSGTPAGEDRGENPSATWPP